MAKEEIVTFGCINRLLNQTAETLRPMLFTHMLLLERHEKYCSDNNGACDVDLVGTAVASLKTLKKQILTLIDVYINEIELAASKYIEIAVIIRDQEAKYSSAHFREKAEADVIDTTHFANEAEQRHVEAVRKALEPFLEGIEGMLIKYEKI